MINAASGVAAPDREQPEQPDSEDRQRRRLRDSVDGNVQVSIVGNDDFSGTCPEYLGQSELHRIASEVRGGSAERVRCCVERRKSAAVRPDAMVL